MTILRETTYLEKRHLGEKEKEKGDCGRGKGDGHRVGGNHHGGSLTLPSACQNTHLSSSRAPLSRMSTLPHPAAITPRRKHRLLPPHSSSSPSGYTGLAWPSSLHLESPTSRHLSHSAFPPLKTFPWSPSWNKFCTRLWHPMGTSHFLPSFYDHIFSISPSVLYFHPIPSPLPRISHQLLSQWPSKSSLTSLLSIPLTSPGSPCFGPSLKHLGSSHTSFSAVCLYLFSQFFVLQTN